MAESAPQQEDSSRSGGSVRRTFRSAAIFTRHAFSVKHRHGAGDPGMGQAVPCTRQSLRRHGQWHIIVPKPRFTTSPHGLGLL